HLGDRERTLLLARLARVIAPAPNDGVRERVPRYCPPDLLEPFCGIVRVAFDAMAIPAGYDGDVKCDSDQLHRGERVRVDLVEWRDEAFHNAVDRICGVGGWPPPANVVARECLQVTATMSFVVVTLFRRNLRVAIVLDRQPPFCTFAALGGRLGVTVPA